MTDGSFRVLAAGIGFTEGPLWLPSGDILVTSMSRGLLYEVPLAATAEAPLRSFETGGGPNGLASSADGLVVVAQNGGASFQSRSPRPVKPGIQVLRDGLVFDELVTGCLAPNDLVFAPDGTLWFTDPGHPADPDFAPRVSRYDFATGALDTVVEGVRFPNGLAFGPDGDFYLADSDSDDILRFTVSSEGLSDRRVFANVTAGGPDGIAFDANGFLYVAAFDTDDIAVFDPEGTLVRRLPTGEKSRPTNLCFAGDELDTLVVTLASGGRVIAFDEQFEGAQP
ncbi:SMP-30/gluconolactonase/LRE family protein [soil metagenome]